MRARRLTPWPMAVLAAVLVTSSAAGQSSLAGETIHIRRTFGAITIDGDLSDEGWRDATRVEKWYEVNPGDNTEPAVKSLAFLTYDDRFFYVAFQFDDPDPTKIRGPLADHDGINGQADDMAGLFLDTLNTGRTAVLFLVNPRNVQYDAVVDDATGENQSPDFFWDSSTTISDRGWNIEIRIPFSSLRYKNVDPQTWGIILYRNYPRGFRYQIASAKLPRGGNCTVCRENPVTGIGRLPSGAHFVVAPYVSASEGATPRDGVPGAPLVGDVKPRGGIDVKLIPNADNAIDVTVKPDFSQVESDTAQISANERFALFFPEKRPFFLEGVDLLTTPIQAVYTRTISAPRWGGRVTGKESGVRYTALVVDDAGGGRSIIPGPNGSSFADRDFGSTVFIGRAKRDIGLSFVGALVTDRENKDGEGHNRAAGPDFQWRLSASDVVTGQILFSESVTPNRPGIADEWSGRRLSGHAVQTTYNHSTTHVDWFALYRDFTSGFRADAGFVPQVGYRNVSGFGGYTVRPKRVASMIRSSLELEHQEDQAGALISRSIKPNVFMQTRLNGFMGVTYTAHERTRAGDSIIARRYLSGFARLSPTRRIRTIGIDGHIGGDIDFANAQPAHGVGINVFASIQPTDHLEIEILRNQRALDVDAEGRPRARLLTARVSRLKSTYTFTSRMFARFIAQYESTTQDPLLFRSRVDPRSGRFSGSALFAYKINWQSVMFAGYGDERELSLDDRGRLQPSGRQFFVKLSYAFQR
jgi:hypothetical protein